MSVQSRPRVRMFPVLLTTTLTAIIVVAGCLKIPLGNPETSKVDPKFAGMWMKRTDKGEVALMHVIPWDARTYLVLNYGARPDAVGAWERGGEILFKAWLTEVKGQTFVTMQVLGEESDEPYVVAKITTDGDSFTARGVQAEFAGRGGARDEASFRKLIEENIDNDKMYLKPDQYFKVGPGDEQMVADVVGLFR
jgi:hypothetical protein